MASKAEPLAWTRCRGRNGWDAVFDIPADMAAEVLNCHFYSGGLAQKRGGSTAQSIGGDSYTGHNALFRFVPGQDETAAELFIVSADTTEKILRVAAGTSADDLTLANDIDASQPISAANHNGKLFFAFNSDENRLHVYDPGYSTTAIRRTGLKAPAAPTAADTGSGSYAATIRYYKVAYTEQRSSVTVRRSELSAKVDFTPSGSGTHARVTKPAAISEGETHWELYGSSDDTTYYLLATTAVGTTTYDDNAAPSSYSSNDAEASAGTYDLMPSVKFLHSNGIQLFGFGAHETAEGDALPPKNGRVWFTPALDSTSTHDDERVSNTTSVQGWLDLARNGAGIDRGISGLGNQVYCFQSKGIYGLTPTENIQVPFRKHVVSQELGAVNHASIVKGEDESGRAALYFLDPELGPYRIGFGGLQWLGKDVKDLWDTVNLAASNVVAHGVYHKSKHQVIWWISTGSDNDPDTAIVYDVTEGRPDADGSVRGGWAKWDGDFAAARCSLMFSKTVGATMSRDLKPYVGLASGTTLLRGDTTDTDDNGTAFQAYIDSPGFAPEPFYVNKAILRSYLVAEAASGVTIQQAFIRASGDETNRTSTVVLTAAGSETDVIKKFEDAALIGAPWFQVRIGDSAAAANAWVLHRWYAALEQREER